MERPLTYPEAIREATDQAMARDPRVILFGLGVDDFTGIYGTTRGLQEKYGPERVFDTPLSEDAMTGVAIGAAFGGLRPIHVHIRMDFVLLCMNQLLNIAAKARYMYGGTVEVPIVVRCVIGKSWGQGAQHSQALHSLFMHVPGIRVVAPTMPYDAKGALFSALAEPNPVLYVEHRMVHFQRGHVPEEPYEVPLGRARTLAEGGDVTIVGTSYMAVEALRARRALEAAGIAAEVIDPVWLAPLDSDAIVRSVAKTKRLLVVDNAWTNCGASAEIITRVIEALGTGGGLQLKRMGFAPVPCPTAKTLENAFYPNAAKIARAAHALAAGESDWQPDPALLEQEVEFKGPF